MVLSVSWALQALMALAVVGSFIPSTSNLAGDIYPEFQALLIPEQETLYYRFFVLMAIAFSITIYAFMRKKGISIVLPAVRRLALIEFFYTLLLAAAAFKVLAYPMRAWPAEAFLIGGLGGAVLLKILHPLMVRKWPAWRERCTAAVEDRFVKGAAFVSGCVLIGMLIYIPDIEGLVARMYAGEQFHHNDSFIMGPVWALEKGLILDWDVISQYGIGFPYLVRWVAKHLTGGVEYVPVIKAMVLLTIAYYILWFWLVRRWLNSAALALAAVILAIKWQLFHPGVYPTVFTYGSATPVRFLADVVFFLLIWKYLTKGHKAFAAAAAAVCGFQIFYLTSEGVYLYCAWLAFTCVMCVQAWPWRKARVWPAAIWMAAAWMMPIIVAVVCFSAAVGHKVFDPMFWGNVREFSGYFLSGFGVEPMTKNILDKQFGAALMGFMVPCVYIATVCAGILWTTFRKKSDPALTMAIVMAIYGLGSYHYFVARSTLTSYYVEGLPFVWVSAFWINAALTRLRPNIRLWSSFLLCATSLVCLMTTHLFMSQPNVFNAWRNPYTNPAVVLSLPGGESYIHHLFRRETDQVKVNKNTLGETEEHFLTEADFKNDEDFKAFFRRDFDFADDAALIRRLTPEGARVPIMSSFEIKMLMQADRSPFFYYFPLVISHPMTSRTLVRTSVYTSDQYNKTIAQLEADKPKYIFMERGLSVRGLPAHVREYYGSFMYIWEYVFNFYEPVDQSKSLIAFRRKSNGT